MIVQTAGGQVEQEIDAVARKVTRPELTLHASEVKRHLGSEIPAQEIIRILTRLGFAVRASIEEPTQVNPQQQRANLGHHHGEVFLVQVPTWRLDVDREIDLIEEIARIYGYNKFPNTLPAFAGAGR